MANVEILSDFYVEATSTRYVKGWKGAVSKELSKRHGPKGTGFLKPATTTRRKQSK
jgi:hypothetical protein